MIMTVLIFFTFFSSKETKSVCKLLSGTRNMFLVRVHEMKLEPHWGGSGGTEDKNLYWKTQCAEKLYSQRLGFQIQTNLLCRWHRFVKWFPEICLAWHLVSLLFLNRCIFWISLFRLVGCGLCFFTVVCVCVPIHYLWARLYILWNHLWFPPPALSCCGWHDGPGKPH